MTSSAVREPDLRPRAVAAAVDGPVLRVTLADGRELSVPLAWFPWLEAAAPELRDDFELSEGGLSIWWDRLEDGLSVPRLLGLPEYP